MTTSRAGRQLARAALANGHAAVDTMTTLGVRVPLFTEALLMPNFAAGFEWNRAVSEKLFAAYDGALAASYVWQKFWLRAASRPPSQAAVAAAFLDAAEKAAGPARRRVRANAKRLVKG